MTKLGRSTTIGCLSSAVLVLATAAWAQTRPPIAEQIAKTYGLDSWDKIEAIRFTFSAQLPGLHLLRSWVWQPKTGEISYEGKDKAGKPVKISYVESQLNNAPANVQSEIDPDFLNDQYNLLFPLHEYWDANTDIQDLGMQKLPLGTGQARHVVVKYPAEGGYTPGDTWELYLGPDNRVEEFVYRSGSNKRVIIATWAGYKKAGPHFLSRPTAAGRWTASRCESPFRMWPSSWRARTNG